MKKLTLSLALVAVLASCKKDDTEAPAAPSGPQTYAMRTMTVGPQSCTADGSTYWPTICTRSKSTFGGTYTHWSQAWTQHGTGAQAEQGDSLMVFLNINPWGDCPAYQTAVLTVHSVGAYTCTSANNKWLVP